MIDNQHQYLEERKPSSFKRFKELVAQFDLQQNHLDLIGQYGIASVDRELPLAQDLEVFPDIDGCLVFTVSDLSSLGLTHIGENTENIPVQIRVRQGRISRNETKVDLVTSTPLEYQQENIGLPSDTSLAEKLVELTFQEIDYKKAQSTQVSDIEKFAEPEDSRIDFGKLLYLCTNELGDYLRRNGGKYTVGGTSTTIALSEPTAEDMTVIEKVGASIDFKNLSINTLPGILNLINLPRGWVGDIKVTLGESYTGNEEIKVSIRDEDNEDFVNINTGNEGDPIMARNTESGVANQLIGDFVMRQLQIDLISKHRKSKPAKHSIASPLSTERFQAMSEIVARFVEEKSLAFEMFKVLESMQAYAAQFGSPVIQLWVPYDHRYNDDITGGKNLEQIAIGFSNGNKSIENAASAIQSAEMGAYFTLPNNRGIIRVTGDTTSNENPTLIIEHRRMIGFGIHKVVEKSVESSITKDEMDFYKRILNDELTFTDGLKLAFKITDHKKKRTEIEEKLRTDKLRLMDDISQLVRFSGTSTNEDF